MMLRNIRKALRTLETPAKTDVVNMIDNFITDQAVLLTKYEMALGLVPSLYRDMITLVGDYRTIPEPTRLLFGEIVDAMPAGSDIGSDGQDCLSLYKKLKLGESSGIELLEELERLHEHEREATVALHAAELHISQLKSQQETIEKELLLRRHKLKIGDEFYVNEEFVRFVRASSARLDYHWVNHHYKLNPIIRIVSYSPEEGTCQVTNIGTNANVTGVPIPLLLSMDLHDSFTNE
jgi:hypothetical protein